LLVVERLVRTGAALERKQAEGDDIAKGPW